MSTKRQLENGKAFMNGLRQMLGVTFSSPAFIVIKYDEESRDCLIPITLTISAKRGKVEVYEGRTS